MCTYPLAVIPSQAHNVYTLADRDRNGTLDNDELQQMQRAVKGIHPELLPSPLTPAFAEQIALGIDTDGSGDVDRVEWITFVTQQAKQHGERPMLKLMQVLGKQLADCWQPGAP